VAVKTLVDYIGTGENVEDFLNDFLQYMKSRHGRLYNLPPG
jgi:uncharacterized protein (DUF433 family)